MRRGRWIALLTALALAAAVLGTAGAAAQEDEAPEASEIGVTEDEIRIAVVADVENAAAPGLFKGSADAVKAWAKFKNKNGGLGGRKVVVDFIDSKLSADEARNGVIQACEEDFALVGTAALFLSNVSDMVGCADQAGNATGIPDIPVVTTEVDQQCSPVTFPINAPQLDCDTRDASPETYRQSGGRVEYYEKEFGDDMHGVFVYPSDLRSANNAGRIVGAGMQELGIAADQEFDVSALAPQNAYTPVVQAIKDQGSNYALNMGPFNATVAMRQEAKLQGVTDPDFIWDCTLQCYDRRLIEQGGADVEGQYVSLIFLPFEEAKTNENLANFLKFTGKGKADGFGAQAWAGATLLGQAVEAVVERDGVNGVTRAAVLEELGSINDFDAEGMIALTDVADRRVTPCYVLVQVQDGEFVRVFPKKKGEFSCKQRTVVEFERDLL